MFSVVFIMLLKYGIFSIKRQRNVTIYCQNLSLLIFTHHIITHFIKVNTKFKNKKDVDSGKNIKN